MNVEHAVRLLAGTFVGISLIGFLVHSPHWLWLAAFVSLNLIQSSFTDICPAEWVFRWMGLPSCTPGDAGDPSEAGGGRRDAPRRA